MVKQIIIIRHGEKTSDKQFYGLSQQGLIRSLYLVDYFNNPKVINNEQAYNKPDLIYCFNKHNCINRSKQLMQPLIDSGIPYNSNFIKLDRNNIPAGIYVATVYSESKIIGRTNIIIQ